MKSLNQCISLFLIFTLLVGSFPAPVAAQAPLACTEYGYAPVPGATCCDKLEKNLNGICEEVPLEDPSLVSCPPSDNCEGGTGCLPLRTEHFYKNLGPTSNSTDPQITENNRVLFMSSLINVANPRSTGESCVHARDCATYSCSSSGVCEDKKVCRKAVEGEDVPAGVICADDMVVDADSGKCGPNADAANDVYIGLADDPVTSNGQSCQFTISDDDKKRAIASMKSIRAMEWFLSTVEFRDDFDCMGLDLGNPGILNQIGTPIYDVRKKALPVFSDGFNQIEDDYATLIGIQETAKANKDQLISIHDQKISAGDLATRQTSGYDGLMMMYRRNNLMRALEEAMFDAATEANLKIGALSKQVKDFKGPGSCTSQYKVKPFPYIKWKKKDWSGDDHWSFHYEVKGSEVGNSSVIKRDGVATVLAAMSGQTKEKAIADFTLPKYFLIDPVLFGGMNYMGPGKSLESDSGFLGIFGGFKDLRSAKYASGNGSFTKMREVLDVNLHAFYSAYKTDKTKRGFIYEPEIMPEFNLNGEKIVNTTSPKDCLDDPGKTEDLKNEDSVEVVQKTNVKRCNETFKPFYDDVIDEGFAHFLAWSYNTKESYKGLRGNASSYQRRLVAKMIVDTQNLTNYYKTVIKERDKQNECLERVINGLRDSDILADDDDDNKDGLIEGGIYFDQTLGNPIGTSSAARKLLGKIPRLTPADRLKFGFNINEKSLSSIGNSSLMDNVASGSNSSQGGGITNSNLAQLAVQRQALLKANAKAVKAGVNLAAKEKALRDTMKLGASAPGSAALGATGVSGNSAAFFGPGAAGKASVSEDEVDGNNKNAVGGADTSGQKVIGVGAANAGANSGFGNFSSSSGHGDSGNSGATDATGLSDHDKDKLRAEYERTKRSYEATDDDGIFKKVSKAYVRNLDKILNKKKIEEP